MAVPMSSKDFSERFSPSLMYDQHGPVERESSPKEFDFDCYVLVWLATCGPPHEF